MGEMFFAWLTGFGAAAIIFGILWFRRSKKAGTGTRSQIEVHAGIDRIRSVGELVVFKVITKEIVTAAEHWFGETGKKYFAWLISTKKMAMIFEFGIDFRYDLRSKDFTITRVGEDGYRLKMPKCYYETHIRDISFYDEQEAKLLPWLVPELLSRALGTGFDETAKNRLKDEAKYQAQRMAEDLVGKMRSEVQNSARRTIEALAKGFGATTVTIDFGEAELIQIGVDDPTADEPKGEHKQASVETA